MGGTGWSHIGEYAGSIAATLEAVQRDVYAGGKFEDWFDHEAGQPKPTFEEFWADPELRSPEGGTHSILDVSEVRDASAYEVDIWARPSRHYEGVYPLTDPELATTFGTREPTRDDFDRAGGFDAMPDCERGSARSVILYRDGSPSEVAFKGASGY
ncbi:hypothetical protein ABH935_007363 [Catenulispora sp. GAS73]|uniref:hypothetical protein n=1 Tax=Catenulispora sp. GAS73 TaxID=3156269 RepID=UPI00351582FF